MRPGLSSVVRGRLRCLCNRSRRGSYGGLAGLELRTLFCIKRAIDGPILW